MNRLGALARGYPLPTWRLPARIVMLLLATFAVWSWFALLDEVTVAEGEVVPEGKVKVIQHLEGGIVREIYVREGDLVKAEAPLVQLDLPSSATNREEIQVRIDGLMLKRARLLAEANGAPLVFPQDEAAHQPAVVAAETRAHEARRQELQSTLAVLGEQERQRTLEIQELKAKLKSLDASLRLAREKLKMSSDLLSSGLTAKMEHVQLESEAESLEGQIAALKAAIPRTEAALAEARERSREEMLRFARAAQDEIPDVEVNIARNRALLVQATDQQVRTQIRSPIDGVVKNLVHNTVGGVVRPGEPIMEIVPVNEQLLVEARLNPADRGYVEVGQRAVVKITTYDFTRYGGLEGMVRLVAPDSTLGPDRQPYFRVVVQTRKSYLGERAGNLPISPGMQAVVEIHTGTRTVKDYLVRPVLKMKHEAFRER